MFNFDGGRRAAENAASTYRGAIVATLSLVGAALVLGSLVAWSITRSLLRRLGGEPATAAAVAQAMAAGDLAGDIPLRRGD
ncbi:MAG TPA: methyl-accepting chemotaxis protein, partial [Burkholderiaceae bacterium]|nr:methyl-accepting chemotaxis protein [Burkholderiaceae bacterium]